MSFIDLFTPITSALPEVKRPAIPPTLKEKLGWTVVILLLFFILGQIYPLGVDSANISRFERLDVLMGSKTGSLITAGIGPIVLASIFLQLAVGAKLISLDLTKDENKRKFQGFQKLLAIALSFFEAGVYVFSNYIPANTASPLLGSIFATQFLIMLQLALGSIILLYFDEVVQKYGIGSGIGLFIAAGVSQSVMVGAFSLAPSATGAPSGLIPQALYYVAGGDIVNAVWSLMPVLFVVVVFAAVVYAEGMKIELPLAYGRARGLGARYPIKFLYVSNIPVILASAVLLNVQLAGMFAANAGMPLLGNYESNQPIDGIAYYTTPLASPLLFPGGYASYVQYLAQPQELLHILFYGLALIALCVIFGWFWIESTGMGAGDIAKQLERAGLQIPGFRQDSRITQKILERYIPIITILGSIFVGVLAWFADITGALGTGTGILLTVGILYKMYEDLAQQQLFEMYPQLKNFVG
ncbi:preprotein translocase subunit SecY [Candidatus Micrarchaeota archaeon CG_4_10_14_0_2_um_filter_60_11]|nr:MAG: preprotein translocase subunit SecY [Candidatus Micrarchaeota archaeon CG1_02_60_51]PIN96513.1 MAG: preprotein translocase subunit SecY [Candidatus Micrarchaeota archaeon CG10_big_fil_rev_8_21_14_0_10_60_32]PIO01828.1 MAG: preprotein translocase subunit SecY [Candidatus Micrarchaeota archaeon CG09_land_8_20_14_0_10_60_16]PIY91905.1 MAG: preprotein translocase subunit SecY [Candidatus Micrarchaeota archaeon CG_4_10_14_0_8_um_filter_60_7]PIZ90833.1 MAG: preprotein translocase subunit SecY